MIAQREDGMGDGTYCEPHERKPTVPVPATASGGPVSHAIFRLTRLHRMVAAQLLRRLGLHPGQELLMMHLWECGPQRQADLAALLGSDSATITRTVHRLERGGFVRRTPSPTDGRSVIVSPTTAGNALRAEVTTMWDELEKRTTAGLDEQGIQATLDALLHMECNLREADN
ncbi:MarR family winged helix-turn-helix transcriptional regulator [Actinokineospora sp. UTMC 2448]|uniref:MarR family winged helix-turn-helix transcriptional regulator n=1 Tax=Actinokineospora sp. UTMC 2448 TaxID=2268449 RepID=UPI0021642557|nr:MarR family winged helix-turn-helix transcriptional regulator [Actinokineospora sp. UTMC 2448]UVS81408.1 transcriptional regulator SlyA [Actinokineospora sp. UTMC 2448]